MAYPFQHQNSWQQYPPATPPYPVYNQPPPPQSAPYPHSPGYPASPPYPGYGGGGYPPQGPPPGQPSPYGYTHPPAPHGYVTPPPVGYNPPPPQQLYNTNLAPPPLQSYNSFSQQNNDPWRQNQRPPTPQPPPAHLPPPPPTTSQAFGYGAPSTYQFQYSLCSGRRKALMIGINYFGQKNELKGCINDVKNMSAFLSQNYGYKREDMVLLTDDARDPRSQPTKANILRAMGWLVQGARKDDSLFFHFSGHGGQTRDQDGDEDDGYDEVIYPVDYKSAGHIVDDDMHKILVTPLAPGVRLTAIFDSCHSGTALDLPYVYSTAGVVKQPNLGKEFGLGLLGSVLAYQRGDVKGAAGAAFSMLQKLTQGSSAREKALRTKTSPADVVMWSGSKDSQTSSDAVEDGESTGAMSWAFQRALKRQPKQSYLQLLQSIRAELEGRYSQKPQLSCSHPLDINLLFVM